jgi:hypothetical protein
MEMQVKGVRFVKGNEFTPLNIVFADIDRRNDLRCVLLHSLKYSQIFTNQIGVDEC